MPTISPMKANLLAAVAAVTLCALAALFIEAQVAKMSFEVPSAGQFIAGLGGYPANIAID